MKGPINNASALGRRFIINLASYFLAPPKKTSKTHSGFFLSSHYKGCKVASLLKLLKQLVATICTLYLVLGTVNATAQHTQEGGSQLTKIHNISIPPLNAADALNRLAKQTGIQLLFPYELARTRNAYPIEGRYRVMDALDQLLQGSGFDSSLSDKGAITISDTGNVRPNNQRERMSMNTKKSLLAAMVGVFATGGVGAVHAQDAPTTEQVNINEVIVTARKREERLIDVPMSVSVVSDKQLKLMGIDNMTDLSFIVPSLTVNEDSSGDQQVTIRGVSNEKGTSPLVGIYLDEIPLRLHAGVHIDLPSADIERVEVLKGPQGTLFGQGATGGVIRYVSKSPTFDALTGDVSARFYDTREGDMSQELIAAVNVPVVADKFAVRIAANYKDEGGWIDQFLVDDENFNDEEVTNIRIRGLLQVTDGLDVDATVVRHRSDAGGSKLVNIGESSESNYLSILSDPDGEGASLNSPGISYEYDVYNITVSYDMGFATLVSSSSKYTVEHDEGSETSLIELDLGGPTLLLGARQGAVRDANALAQEIRLSGDTESMGWNLGVFYTDVDTFLSLSSTTHMLDQNSYENILLLAPFTSVEVPSSSNSTAVFGDVSYRLTEEITASFGARYYEDEIETFFSGQNIDDDFDNLSLKGSLSYALSDNMNIYFSVAEGFRSGGVNTPGGQPFEPEKLISYELGSKGEILEGRLSFELAMYFSEYDDYQESVFLNDGTFVSITQNPGSAELKGVEWSIAMNLTEQLRVGFNGNISESEFTEVAENPNIFDVGDPLNGVPDHSYSISVDYGFNLTSSMEGFAHLDYSRTGESTRIFRGNPLVGIDDVEETAAVGYLNAQLGVKWDSMTIKLFGKNLNNELRSPNSGAAATRLQRRPRTIGVDLSYAF